jgi:hypothetical protein
MKYWKTSSFSSKGLVILFAICVVLPGMQIILHDPFGAEGASVESGGASGFAPWWNFGWGFRKGITINNADNTNTLPGYQLLINVSYNSHMNPDFSDLRFTQYNSSLGHDQGLSYWISDKVNGVNASVWVKSDEIKGSDSSTIYMYYGNSSSVTTSNRTDTFDLYNTFDSDLEGWIYTGTTGYSLSLDNTQGNPASSAHISGDYVVSTVAVYAYMEKTLNKGIGTGLSITVDYRASSGTTTSSCTNANLWLMDPGDNQLNSSAYVSGGITDTGWVLNQRKTVVAEIQSVSQIKIRLGLGDAWQTNWNQNNWFDNIRVTKYTSPEPSYAIGVEERPFMFKSMTHSPVRMNVGEPVFFNASFTNPTPETIKVQLAAREADDFNSTSDYFYQEEVALPPSTDTTFAFTWTAVGGPHTIWLAVYDYPFASAKINVNRDPAIEPVKDQSLLQDKEFMLQLNASDPDGDQLSWSIDNPLFNLTEVSNRSAEISFLPTNDNVGLHRANVTVRDPSNRSDTRRINFTVNNVNDPPVLAKIPPLSATQYKELRYQAKASDVDVRWGDVLTFSDNTDLFEIDAGTGEFYFIPVEEQVGKHNIKITVTDKEGASAQASFTITVDNVNDPPTLEILPPQSALQGRPFQLKVVAADPDLKSDPTEKLRFSDDSLLFSINNDTGLISFTATNDQIGVWPANITVTDKGGLSNTTQLTITVTNANDPPAIEAIAAQTATEDQPFQFQVNATDPDMKWGLDNLTFTDDTDIFNIDPKTGVIEFTPTSAQVGIKRVTITVKDEKGATASASFDLTVVHVNHPPTGAVIKYPLDGARLKEGDQMFLDGTAKDSDKGDTLEYSWLDNGEPAGIGKNISVKLKPGKHTITLEVSDATETVSTEINIEIIKKEQVTVATSGMMVIGGAVAAVLALLVVVGVLVMTRRRKTKSPAPDKEAGATEPRDEEPVALPPVPPAEASLQGQDEEARKIIDTTVERLADYQEAHPEEALDVGPVMEKLDIAREFLKSGEYDDALDFAREAEAAVLAMTAPRAPKRVAIKKKKAIAVKDTTATKDKTASAVKKCPGCGEKLDASWPVCPACGRNL